MNLNKKSMVNKSVSKEAKSKSGQVTTNEFFNKLVEKSGYMDPDQVKRVYYGMKDLVFEQLRATGGIELPDLCDIYLSKAKPRIIKNRFMEAAVKKEGHHQVRIVPKWSMKEYFKTLQIFYEGKEFDPAVRAGLK